MPGERPRSAAVTPSQLGIGVLFDAIRDAVVVADEHGSILLWNDGAAGMFGWTREEAVGRNVLMLIPEGYRAQHNAGIARYAATGHGPLVDTRMPIELPALRKDGREITVELTLAPVENVGGRYALALLRDVTERVRLRRDLERRGEDLERSMKEVSRVNDSLTAFTYVVSHDLKEPVRAIDTYLRILREDHGSALSPDGADLLSRALVSTDRLGALLRGLLDLSRVDRELLDAKSLALGEVLASETCRAAYEGLFRERGAALEVAPGIPDVLASPSVLCQVFSNLLTNAVRHNPAAAPRVRVDARRIENDCVEVVVEDNGPGFPLGFMERFNGGVPPSLRSGFGLLIARRAVERLGGHLLLGSSPVLGGAAVRFTAPAAP
jgi:PAS domain S-box-containing protein